MLNSVKKIKEIGLQPFVDLHHLNLKRHKKYPNLVLLKYDQIESQRNNPEVDECRGLILDEDQDYKVVSMPYRRFYNVDEHCAAKIDWSTAKVYEKKDGSLISLYYYDNKWNVATSGTPDASGPIDNSGKTFEELFWETWNKLNYQLPKDTHLCYMFELCTPFNIILVRHSTYDLFLHGARNVDTLQEVDPETIANENQWHLVPSYQLNNLEDILASLQNIDPSQQEGYVVVDANFNRVKIKSPQYVALSHIKEGLSSKRLLEIVRNNEGGEFLSYFPEYKEQYEQLQDKYKKLVAEVQTIWESLDLTTDQKTFALKVKDYKFSSLFFMMKAGKIKSFKQGLLNTNIDNLFEWLKIF